MNTRFKFLSKISRSFHREFLDPILIRLFASKASVICSVYNSEPVTPESVISNFFQSMILSGTDKNEKMYWYRKDDLYWEIYNKRTVITAETAHISKRLRQYMRKELFDIKINTDFDKLIRACQREEETWITDSLINVYKTLYAKGYVQTMEAYRDGELVGGLWGLVIGKTFSAMSVFHNADKAGSIVFASLVKRIVDGEFEMIDVGLTNIWNSFGAKTIPRNEFMTHVVNNMNINQ